MKHPKTGIDGLDSYCEGVVTGEISVCQWVRKAVQRHYRDMSRAKSDEFPYYFEPKAAAHFFDFCYRRKHYEGEVAGKPIILEPWQQFVWGSIFGWLHRDTKYRRFRETHIEIPKKQGKSLLGALIALYGITYDNEPGAQVYNLAINRTQAMKLSYRAAQEMSETDEELKELLQVKRSMADMKIECKINSSFFEPLTSKPDRLDGFNVHMSINDETKDWDQIEVYDLMEDGTATRSQPLLYNVTTAGDNRNSLGYLKRDYSVKVLDQVLKDEFFFCVIYTIDEEDLEHWDNVEVWKKANPNYGISVQESYFMNQITKGRESQRKKNDVLTKNLNVWVSAYEQWIDPDRWRQGQTEKTMMDLKDLPCVLSLDLASKIDLAALALMFFDVLSGTFYFFHRFYLPEEVLSGGDSESPQERANRKEYQVWADQGWITLTPGARIDQEYIKQDIIDLCRMYDVRKVAYDPFQATKLVTELEKENLPLLEYRHTVLNMSEPMKELEAGILQGTVQHEGNPVLTWMMSNVVAKEDVKGNIYPRKADKERKIDGAVACIMAIGTYLFTVKDNEQKNISPYAARAAAKRS